MILNIFFRAEIKTQNPKPILAFNLPINRKKTIFVYIISPMKTKHFFLFLLFSPALFFSSCQPDEQPTPSSTDARDVYVASWTCNETSSQIGPSTFTVHINKVTTNTTQVQIENFYNIGFNFNAKVDISGTSMSIPLQTVNGNQVHGSGTKTGANSISLSYYVNNGSGVDTCTATLARQ